MTSAGTPRVLAAIDLDDPVAAPTLPALVLDTALAMADLWGAELYLVHPWTASWEMVLRTHLSGPQVDGYLRDRRLQAGQGVRRFLAPYRDRIDERRVELVRGSLEGAIESAVTRLDVDLVVVGTMARRGLSRLILGNAAERLSGRVNADLLVIKPPSFVSPRQPALPAAVAL